MDKLKWACIGVLIGLVVGYFVIPRQPTIETKKDTIYVKGTTTVVYKANTSVTNATSVTVRPDGETIASGVNLSIGTASETHTTTVTEFKEIIKIKYNTTAFLFLNVGHCVTIEPNIFTPNKTIGMNIENISVGLSVRVLTGLISLDYQHLNSLPDIAQLRVSIPIF